LILQQPANVDTVCSIGGFTVLSTAAKYPELVKGLVLLNVAGKFADKDEKAPVVSGSDITKEVRAV
jgi:pimeloyl-ACP methyl ester carboxylesterase